MGLTCGSKSDPFFFLGINLGHHTRDGGQYTVPSGPKCLGC